jgi:hypothetical protein
MSKKIIGRVLEKEILEEALHTQRSELIAVLFCAMGHPTQKS